MLKNDAFVAKFGVDTAENEPAEAAFLPIRPLSGRRPESAMRRPTHQGNHPSGLSEPLRLFPTGDDLRDIYHAAFWILSRSDHFFQQRIEAALRGPFESTKASGPVM